MLQEWKDVFCSRKGRLNTSDIEINGLQFIGHFNLKIKKYSFIFWTALPWKQRFVSGFILYLFKPSRLVHSVILREGIKCFWTMHILLSIGQKYTAIFPHPETALYFADILKLIEWLHFRNDNLAGQIQGTPRAMNTWSYWCSLDSTSVAVSVNSTAIRLNLVYI